MDIGDIGPEIREIKQRLDRLEKRRDANTSLDTARMDWLEANRAEVKTDFTGSWWVSGPGEGAERGSLREAIDAAMAGCAH